MVRLGCRGTNVATSSTVLRGAASVRTLNSRASSLGARRGFASGVTPKVVEVYTTAWCPFCDRIRALLNSKGVQYKEIDVTSVAGAKDEMEKRTNGRRTVPQLFIDGEYIGDCDGTHKLDAQGLLDAKLGLKERSTA